MMVKQWHSGVALGCHHQQLTVRVGERLCDSEWCGQMSYTVFPATGESFSEIHASI